MTSFDKHVLHYILRFILNGKKGKKTYEKIALVVFSWLNLTKSTRRMNWMAISLVRKLSQKHSLQAFCLKTVSIRGVQVVMCSCLMTSDKRSSSLHHVVILSSVIILTREVIKVADFRRRLDVAILNQTRTEPPSDDS